YTPDPVPQRLRDVPLAEQIATNEGEGLAVVPGLSLTKHEMYLLIKHWYREARDTEFFWYIAQCVGSIERRLKWYADGRFNAISSLLGPEATARAIAEVDQEFRTKHPYHYRAFLGGVELLRDAEGCPFPEEKQPKPWLLIQKLKTEPRTAA